MRKSGYVPDRGDIVWLQFNSQSWHEQDGHRPALVLSPASYNRASGLMLCCPMTSQQKGYPFEVVISDDPHRTSVVLADQIKSLDWKTRQAVKKGTASSNVVMETLSKLQTLL
ncbi:MAG: mRNA-degrading endonuclease [Nitrospira sp.]